MPRLLSTLLLPAAAILIPAAATPQTPATTSTMISMPAASAPPAADLRAIFSRRGALLVDGDRVLGRHTAKGNTHYLYNKRGQLLLAAGPNGFTARYHYENDRLERITFADGREHTAVYDGERLAAIDSSTGKRLGISPGADKADRVMSTQRKQDASLTAGRSVAVAPGDPAALNRVLVAAGDWENSTDEWECVEGPQGEIVCIGRAPGTGGGGDSPFDGAPMPEPPGPGSSEPGGEATGGGQPEPRADDRIPPDLETQESCIQAAINTYEIMIRDICKYVTNKDTCSLDSYRLMLELIAACKITYPNNVVAPGRDQQ